MKKGIKWDFKPTISNKVLLLAAKALRDSAESYSSNGCNDIPDDWWGEMTEAEKQDVIEESFHSFVGENPEHEIESVPDYWVMMWVARLFEFHCTFKIADGENRDSKQQ